jgi:hypothetical protein
MKGCLVTVAAAFQGNKVSKLGDVDVCKETLVHLTEWWVGPLCARTVPSAVGETPLVFDYFPCK